MDPSSHTPPATDPRASELVASCERAWRSIREHHAELPDVVVILGTGVERGRLVKLGHWWSARWLADGALRGEVLLAGEALHLKPEDVFEVLLHESAHGLSAARGIKDTSRNGRYHNARFKAVAAEVGLKAEPLGAYGWAQTVLTADATSRYADSIADLASTMRIARALPRDRTSTHAGGELVGTTGGSTPDADAGKPKTPAAECGCGRRMRMAPSILAKGPVRCEACGTHFTAGAELAQPAHATDHEAATDQDPTAVAVESLRALARQPGGVERLLEIGAWVDRLDTPSETPIPVTGHGQRAEWDTLARDALSALGRLSGPELTGGSRPLRVGDRVVVEAPHDLLPDVGVPGSVTEIDPDRARVTIDFPIAGTYAFDVDEPAMARLAYGYCEITNRPLEKAAAVAPPARVAPSAGVEL